MHTRRARVVIATRMYLPEPQAAALRLGGLARALADHGAQVVVLTSRAPVGPPAPVPGVVVRRAPVLRDSTGAVRGYLPYLSFDIPLFFRLLTCPRPDVVVNEPPPTTGVVTRLACMIRRIPYVYYAGDIVSDAARAQGTHRLVVATVAAMERWSIRGAARIVAVTEGVAERVWEMSGKTADLVPNGIDTFSPPGKVSVIDQHPDWSEPPAGFPANGGSPIFLYAGTVADWLGPEIFIDAMVHVRATLPGAVLVYLGQGSAWDSLRTRAPRDGSVHFHGAVSPKDVRRWYAWADVAVASIRPGAYDYAYPTKLLAALAQGTPVVFAGPGQAARDIPQAALGRAAEFRAEDVARAMIAVAMAPPDDPVKSPLHLYQWVDEHRSSRESSARAAQVVLWAIGAPRETS